MAQPPPKPSALFWSELIRNDIERGSFVRLIAFAQRSLAMLSTGDNFSYLMIFLWFLGAGVLGLGLAYGIKRSGWLSRRERRQLDQNTRMAQSREDQR